MADKYREACIEYAKRSADVRALSKKIGDALGDCSNSQLAAFNKDHPGSWMIPVFAEHLKMAYAMDREHDGAGGYEPYFVNHDDDVIGYLTETCPHCLAAHLAIQERKAARKRLGIAKQRIGILGRAAAAQQPA